jgi:hypothetical protein
MGTHLKESMDLLQRKVLSVSKCHYFVECTQQLEAVTGDVAFFIGFADGTDDLTKQVKGVDVLEDVRRAVGDEDYVELVLVGLVGAMGDKVG